MTEDNVFYVGVDVSKAKHAIAIAEGRRNGEVRYFGEIEATPAAVERFVRKMKPTSHMQLRDIRQLWEHHTNRHLARLGLDVRVDHRSHLERGLEIEPTEHMGVHSSQMNRRGLEISRERIDRKAGRSNADLIRSKPGQVLSIITGEKSVFDRHDVARALHRYIDDVDGFRNAFAAVMASPALVELRPETDRELARYSTREMVEIERAMAASAERMGQSLRHGVDRQHDRAVMLVR